MTPSGCVSRGSGVRDRRVLCVIYVYFKELNLIRGIGWRERRARGTVMPWGPRGAGKATWVWAWGVLICVGRVLFAGLYTPKWLFWVFVEKGAKIRRFGVVGAVPAVDSGLVGLAAWEDFRISIFWCRSVAIYSIFCIWPLLPVWCCLVS